MKEVLTFLDDVTLKYFSRKMIYIYIYIDSILVSKKTEIFESHFFNKSIDYHDRSIIESTDFHLYEKKSLIS